MSLSEELKTITSKIKKYHKTYDEIEEAVRSQIIEPVLRGLGWNTEDPQDVVPNAKTGDGFPDYTLLHKDRKVLFIEAKNMSVDIGEEDVLRQLAKYCLSEGVEYGLLTNGVKWVLFKTFEKNTTFRDRKVWAVDIENEDKTAVERKLNTIAKNNIHEIKKLIEKMSMLDEVWESLKNDPTKIAPVIAPVFDNLIKEAYPKCQISQDEIKDFIAEKIKDLFNIKTDIPEDEVVNEDQHGGKPEEMTIKNEKFKIQKARDILINAAEWLIKQGKLTKEKCPIASGPKRYLVNIEPKHRYEKDFISIKKLSNGLYLETNYSAPGCIESARTLIEKCGENRDILKIVSK